MNDGSLQTGVHIGPYAIIAPLGAGGMGAVYLAYDERLDRRVALKMLTHATGGDAARHLFREARAIARLNHPNIAGLYDVFEHDAVPFLVMEYVDGEPLSALVRSQPVPVDRVLDVGLQLAGALAYAHREGIIHRDIKPSNVMLTRDGTLKVLDLGLAQVTAVDPAAPTRTASEIGMRSGTPAYMAPERLSGQPSDARADVYSAGVLLYELLTGVRPFEAPDMMAAAVNAVTQPTPRVSSLRPDVPPVFDDLVARAMAKDAALRYASADELRDGLVLVRDQLSGASPAAWLVASRHGRRRLVLIAGVIAVLAGATWLEFRRSAASVPPTIAVSPVTNASMDQADLDEIGVLLQSVLSRDLATLPGITIVAGAVPATNGTAGPPSPAAGHTVSLTIRRAVAGIAADVDLIRLGETRPIWHDHFEGDAVGLLQFATDKVATALERSGVPARMLTDPERARLRRLPTEDRQALASYLNGRTTLDTSDDRKTDDLAAGHFRDAVTRDGSFAFALAGLSQTYSSLRKHTSEAKWLPVATDAAKQALAIDPACDQAHVAAALAFRASGRKDDATLEARQAVDLTPASDDARRVLGLTLMDQGQTDAGLAELRTAIAIRPRHWMNYYVLGRSLLAGHKYREAVDLLQVVRDQLPGFESAYVNLGFAYMSLGNWDLAVGNLERARQLDRTDHYASTNLATAYYWNRQFEQALAMFQQAITQDPGNPKQFMNLGDAYEALGRKGEARIAYAKAIALADARQATFDPATEAIAAKCEAKLGNPHAEGRALAALAVDEKNAEVLYKLAVVYALSHQVAKALDRLEQAINLGYSPVLVRDDRDMHELSSEPTFKRLIAKAGR